MTLNREIIKQIESIHAKMEEYKAEDKRIFVSSSFQTHSIPLLHIISNVDHAIPVYFLNTGFHFPETHVFVRQVKELLQLNLHMLSSSVPKSQQKDESENFLFTSNPKRCCDINKVDPMEPILREYDVWITGIRKDQNAERATMKMEENSAYNVIRFHPMLDWNSKMILEYRNTYQLPAHPLQEDGYLSIGCEPCTEKYMDQIREGRWKGQLKNECGLHTDLIINTNKT